LIRARLALMFAYNPGFDFLSTDISISLTMF
jgi:hypothetical protein